MVEERESYKCRVYKSRNKPTPKFQAPQNDVIYNMPRLATHLEEEFKTNIALFPSISLSLYLCCKDI